jgi:hypothetical protein
MEVEPLGDRILPSASPLSVPAAPLAAALAAQQPPVHILTGHGQGTYTADQIMSGAGAQYRLQGTANLAGLGRVTVSGSVSGVGFIQHGHAGGTLTFSNARGSVTLQLQGPDQPGFSALPQGFHYRVVGATGAYKGLAAQGSLQLVLHASPLPMPGAGMVTPHGTFTLTI